MGGLLLDPSAIEELCESLPDLGLARQAHACTHMTIAPTIVHGGTKMNVIPDQVDLDLDVRTLPGQTEADVRSLLAEAIGRPRRQGRDPLGSRRPRERVAGRDPLWDELDSMVQPLPPRSRERALLHRRGHRRALFPPARAVAYGFGMFSDRMSFEQFLSMFHGDDERVDVESLALSAEMFEALPRSFLT